MAEVKGKRRPRPRPRRIPVVVYREKGNIYVSMLGAEKSLRDALAFFSGDMTVTSFWIQSSGWGAENDILEALMDFAPEVGDLINSWLTQVYRVGLNAQVKHPTKKSLAG